MTSQVTDIPSGRSSRQDSGYSTGTISESSEVDANIVEVGSECDEVEVQLNDENINSVSIGAHTHSTSFNGDSSSTDEESDEYMTDNSETASASSEEIRDPIQHDISQQRMALVMSQRALQHEAPDGSAPEQHPKYKHAVENKVQNSFVSEQPEIHQKAVLRECPDDPAFEHRSMRKHAVEKKAPNSPVSPMSQKAVPRAALLGSIRVNSQHPARFVSSQKTAQHAATYSPFHTSTQNPAQDRPFTVGLKDCYNSKTYKFQVKNSNMTDELMKDIDNGTPSKIPARQQRLVYAGKTLQAGKTMAFYKVEPDQTIHLTARVHGG